jgi:hypothetical protein
MTDTQKEGQREAFVTSSVYPEDREESMREMLARTRGQERTGTSFNVE